MLDRAADLVKKGGRIAYITCSVLPVENDGAMKSFLSRRPEFKLISPAKVATDASLPELAAFPSVRGNGLQLSPLRTGTDGFFVALLRKET